MPPGKSKGKKPGAKKRSPATKPRRKKSSAESASPQTQSDRRKLSQAEIDREWPAPTQAEIDRVLKHARLAAAYIGNNKRDRARREARYALEVSRDKYGALVRLLNRLKQADPADERWRSVKHLLEDLGPAALSDPICSEGIKAYCDEIEAWFGAESQNPSDAKEAGKKSPKSGGRPRKSPEFDDAVALARESGLYETAAKMAKNCRELRPFLAGKPLPVKAVQDAQKRNRSALHRAKLGARNRNVRAPK